MRRKRRDHWDIPDREPSASFVNLTIKPKKSNPVKQTVGDKSLCDVHPDMEYTCHTSNRTKSSLPMDRSEEEVERMWAYKSLLGRSQ